MMATASVPTSAAPFPFVPVLGPSPYESEHSSLVSQLTSVTDEIGRLTALSIDLQQQLADVTDRRKAWIEAETARLLREEEERREREERERKEREERERQEREERERVEREERERKEREERERKEREEREEKERQRLEAERLQRVEQERREREEREAAERAAQQAEKERLQREWLEKEKAETAQREEAERRELERREREAALAASGQAAAGSVPRELRLRCEALYDLEGDASNDELSFTTGETFLVSGEMNGWMSARSEKTGKVGLVPSNYLRVLEELEPPSEAAPAALDASGSSSSSSASGVVVQDAAAKDKKGELVVALFDFAGENDDELSFSTGDRLYKTGEVNGWYIGTHEKGEKVGIFPSNFVEMLAEPAVVATAAAAPLQDKAVEEKTAFTSSSQPYSSAADDDVALQSAPDVRRTKSTAFAAAEVASLAQAAQEANAPSTPRSSSGIASPAFSSPASPSSVPNVEHDAIALYRFTATSSDQLSFEKGAKLIIRNARLNGWYVGAVLGKEGPGPLGIFPANYVQRVEKEQPAETAGSGAAGGKAMEEQKQADDEERSYLYKQQRMSGGSEASAAITSSVSTPSLSSSSASVVSSSAPIIGRVTALYDFESTTAENLSFHRGDEIAVVKEIKGWWAGFMVGKDKLGLVPSNYCSPFRPEPAAAAGTTVTTTSSSAGPLPSQLVGGEWRPAPANGAGATSASPSTDASSGSSSAGNTPSRVSMTSTPPPLSAKPVLLSSLAMSNAISKGAVQPVTTLTPMSSVPNSINVSPVPAVNAASSSTPAPLTSSSATAANSSSSSSMSSAAPVNSVAAAPVSQQYPTVMAGTAYSANSWSSSSAPASAAAPAAATAVAAPQGSYPVVNTMGPPGPPSGFNSTAVQQPPPAATSAGSASPAPVVMVPISTSSSRRSGERLAVAIHDWDTTERGELSFRKDDRLVITKEKQGWYTGYLEAAPQRKGMFPSMAVEPLTSSSSSSSSTLVSAPSAAVGPSIATTASNSPAESAPTTPVSGSRSLSQNSRPASAAQPASGSGSVAQLERGMVVTKLDTRGRDPKQVRLYLEREKLSRNRRGDWIVRWDTKKFNKREAQVTVARCRVKRGLKRSSEAEPNAFTIIGPSRDLEIICADTNDRELWIDALLSLSVPLEQALPHDNNAVMQLPQQQQQMVQVQMLQTVQTAMPQQQQTKVEDEVSIHQILKDGPPPSSLVSIPGPASAASAQAQSQSQAPAVRDGSNYAGHMATALYDFGSEKEDLVIVAGDRIELTEAEAGNQWWHGRNATRGGGKIGMFPASYVQLDANPPAVVKTVTVVAPTSSPGVTIAPAANAAVVTAPASVPSSGSSAAQPVVKAKAMYDFDTNGAEFPDDLPFKRNDVLTLISYGPDMEWWTGVDSKGRKGIFPATFVAIL